MLLNSFITGFEYTFRTCHQGTLMQNTIENVTRVKSWWKNYGEMILLVTGVKSNIEQKVMQKVMTERTLWEIYVLSYAVYIRCCEKQSKTIDYRLPNIYKPIIPVRTTSLPERVSVLLYKM